MIMNDPRRVWSIRAVGLAAVVLGVILLVPLRVHAQAIKEAGKQELREAYGLLRAQKVRAALCAFKRAYELTSDPTSLLGRAYCELRQSHYSHARSVIAQVAEPQREAALSEELLGAIAEYQRGSAESNSSAPSASAILGELGSIDAKMRRYAFQLGAEYNPQTLTLAINTGSLIPDLDSPPDHHTLLVLSDDDFCDRPVRAVSRAGSRNAVPPQKRGKHEPMPAPGAKFELLVEPDNKYELTLSPDRFNTFVHRIPSTGVPDGVIKLSQAEEQATIATRVAFEGWQPTSQGTDTKPPPVDKVELEVRRGKVRVYKGKNHQISVSPATYLVRVIPPGYGFRYESSDWRGVQLIGGQSPTLDFTLDKRPVYRNPWFWVGLLGGAATAGLVVGLVVPQLTDPRWDRGTTEWLVRLDLRR